MKEIKCVLRTWPSTNQKNKIPWQQRLFGFVHGSISLRHAIKGNSPFDAWKSRISITRFISRLPNSVPSCSLACFASFFLIIDFGLVPLKNNKCFCFEWNLAWLNYLSLNGTEHCRVRFQRIADFLFWDTFSCSTFGAEVRHASKYRLSAWQYWFCVRSSSYITKEEAICALHYRWSGSECMSFEKRGISQKTPVHHISIQVFLVELSTYICMHACTCKHYSRLFYQSHTRTEQSK